jgi:hypothetical protein
MIREPYGPVCLVCADYIDARGAPAGMIPARLRRAVLDLFRYGAMRAKIKDANYGDADDGTDPFDFDFRP